jgi:hypothetical protein
MKPVPEIFGTPIVRIGTTVVLEALSERLITMPLGYSVPFKNLHTQIVQTPATNKQQLSGSISTVFTLSVRDQHQRPKEWPKFGCAFLETCKPPRLIDRNLGSASAQERYAGQKNHKH